MLFAACDSRRFKGLDQGTEYHSFLGPINVEMPKWVWCVRQFRHSGADLTYTTSSTPAVVFSAVPRQPTPLQMFKDRVERFLANRNFQVLSLLISCMRAQERLPPPSQSVVPDSGIRAPPLILIIQVAG